MSERDLEDNVFRHRLLKEVAPGVAVHLSFYSPSVKVRIMHPAEHLSGTKGLYSCTGNGVTTKRSRSSPTMENGRSRKVERRAR